MGFYYFVLTILKDLWKITSRMQILVLALFLELYHWLHTKALHIDICESLCSYVHGLSELGNNS